MCQAVQRKRFFATDLPRKNLPTTLEPDFKVLPPRSKSFGGRLSPLRPQRDIADDAMEWGNYGNAVPMRQSRRCNPHLTLASVVTCLVLAPLLVAILYQRKSDLGAMNQIKHDIANHLQQIKEFSDLTKAGLGKLSLYGDMDTDKQVLFLEDNRLKMQQSIQLLSRRMLLEK